MRAIWEDCGRTVETKSFENEESYVYVVMWLSKTWQELIGVYSTLQKAEEAASRIQVSGSTFNSTHILRRKMD